MTGPSVIADLVLLVALLVAAGGAQWLVSDLRTVPRGEHATRPASESVSVSIVIPARDEETTIPPLLESLGRLSVEVSDVVVVDDGSRDATAATVRSAGFDVVRATAPPPGWTGKAWACHLGADAGHGDLLLFLDADTVLGPDAVSGLLALHERHGGGLVSVQPFHTVERAYEQLSAYFNVMSILASGVFAPRPGVRPMAFGPCLLTSRADYERIGGHGAVRGEILDDVQLAVAYHREGLPVVCAVGDSSIRMRSYPGGLRQLTDGWTKNFASGASSAPPGPAVAAVLWLAAHHAVAVGAVLALVEAVVGRGVPLAHGHLAFWAVAWLGVAAQLSSFLRRIGSFRWWTWVLFPLPLLAFDVLFARSAALTAIRRSVRWRGRTVDLGGRGSAGEGL